VVAFVQVKDALELDARFAFLAVRFAIAGLVLAGPAATRVRSLGRGLLGAGALLGGAYRSRLWPADGRSRASQGVEHRLLTGLYVVLTKAGG
jgi:hypothetical protein